MAWLTGYAHRKQLAVSANGSIAGTVSVTNGLNTVVGVGTAFTQWGQGTLASGTQIQLPDGNWYTVSTITTDTAMTITIGYPGGTLGGQPYTMRLVNYQMLLNVFKNLGYTSEATPDANQVETVVYGIIGNELFWGSGFGATGVGYVYKTNLTTGARTTLYGPSGNGVIGFGSWGTSVIIGSDIYVSGEDITGTSPTHQRLMLMKVNTSGITQAFGLNTDDCNESFSIASDGSNFVCGEKGIGGLNTYSSWPNGGGLWTVPIATWNTPASWTRVYEDPTHYYWITIVYRSGTWYALLSDSFHTTGRWKVQHSTDLVNWTVDLDYSAQNTTFYSSGGQLIVAGSSLIALGPVAADGKIHMFVFNGSSWTDYNTTVSYPAETSNVNGYWDSTRSKVVMFVGRATSALFNIYELNIDNTSLATRFTNLAGWIGHVSSTHFQDSSLSTGEVFYPVIYTSGTTSQISKVGAFASGNSVYLGGRCLDSFADVHFTQSDGTTELPYWKETLSSGVSETVWVTFNSVPASPSLGTFYAYHGNSGASSASNISTTFLFGDDFERGNNGDAVGGSWDTVTLATISTTYARDGTRSARIANTGSLLKNFTPVTTAVRCWGYYPTLLAQVLNISVAYGTKYTAIYIGPDGNVHYGDGSDHNTGAASSAGAWHLYETRNVNQTAGTYDIYLDEVLIQAGATMGAYVHAPYTQPQNQDGNPTVYGYFDDFILRNFVNPEPTWGTWGVDETLLIGGKPSSLVNKVLAMGMV